MEKIIGRVIQSELDSEITILLRDSNKFFLFQGSEQCSYNYKIP